MAYLPNPYYGAIPGAPQALNWWEGPQFRMSGIMPTPVALPPPPPPLAATVTPQDVAASTAFVPPRTDTGGAQAGGGGPGSGPGGLGGASGGGQDTTTSGYQGVYAQSPVDLESRFGEAGGLIGAGAGSLSGIPGVGTVLGFGGGMLDAARYNATNAQYGLPGTINPWGAGFAQALAGIGIPFTDLNLARAFGVPTVQQRQDALINAAAPGLYNNPGYGALQANQPVGPAVVGAPPSASYPPGFLDWSAAQQPAAAPVDKSTAAFTEADLAGWADAMAGKGGTAADMGQSTGYGGDKGAVGTGQEGGSGGTSSSGGGSKGGDPNDGLYARGGLIGRPPGSYAAGGAVRAAGRMPTRLEPPPIDIVPRDYMSDTGRQYMNDTPMEPPPPSPREQMIQDAMRGYGIGRNRDGYPEGFAAGGQVPPTPGDNITPAQFGALRAINPPGPDDQIGALQTGEGVIRKDAMQRYPGLLAAINAGTLDPGRVKGLLTPAGMGRKPRLIR